MFKSAYSTHMSASMHLAEEFLDAEGMPEDFDRASPPGGTSADAEAGGSSLGSDFGGLESLADFIDGVFGRSEVSIRNTSAVLRMQDGSGTGFRIGVGEVTVSGEVLQDPSYRRPGGAAKAARRSAFVAGIQLAVFGPSASASGQTPHGDFVVLASPERSRIEVDADYERELCKGGDSNVADFRYRWKLAARLPLFFARLQPSVLRTVLHAISSHASPGPSASDSASGAYAQSVSHREQENFPGIEIAMGGLEAFVAFEDGLDWLVAGDFFEVCSSLPANRAFGGRSDHLHLRLQKAGLSLSPDRLRLDLGDLELRDWRGRTFVKILEMSSSPGAFDVNADGSLPAAEREFLFPKATGRRLTSPTPARPPVVVVDLDRKPAVAGSPGTASPASQVAVSLAALRFRLDPTMWQRIQTLWQACRFTDAARSSLDSASDSDEESSISPPFQSLYAPRWECQIDCPSFSMWLFGGAIEGPTRAGPKDGAAVWLTTTSLSLTMGRGAGLGTFGWAPHLAVATDDLSVSVVSYLDGTAGIGAVRSLVSVGRSPGSESRATLEVLGVPATSAEPESAGGYSIRGSTAGTQMLRSWYDLTGRDRSPSAATESGYEDAPVSSQSPGGPETIGSRLQFRLRCPAIVASASDEAVREVLSFSEHWRGILFSESATAPHNATQSSDRGSNVVLLVHVENATLRYTSPRTARLYVAQLEGCSVEYGNGSFKVGVDALEVLELDGTAKDSFAAFLSLVSGTVDVKPSSNEIKVVMRLGSLSAGVESWSALVEDLGALHDWSSDGRSQLSGDIKPVAFDMQVLHIEFQHPASACSIIAVVWARALYVSGSRTGSGVFSSGSLAGATLLIKEELSSKRGSRRVPGLARPPRDPLTSVGSEPWRERGLTDVAHILDVACTFAAAEGDVKADVSRGSMSLETCADSYASLLALVDYVAALFAEKAPSASRAPAERLHLARWNPSSTGNDVFGELSSALLEASHRRTHRFDRRCRRFCLCSIFRDHRKPSGSISGHSQHNRGLLRREQSWRVAPGRRGIRSPDARQRG
ncbi:hypothetical protein DFJ74DRAFT_108299 [Hyaloraphidium curvatum]|nr:hypothetical protein DFJ74DRAFT_108299 [Hyaloraphidium curvatum]